MTNIVYYSNCQFMGLNFFLNKTIKNLKSFHIINYQLIKEDKPIPINILQKADIFIYQPIDKKHNIYSTDKTVENNILTHLRSDCIKISYPYIYHSSLWIFLLPSFADGFIANYSQINHYVNTEPITKLKNKGYSLNKVLQMYRDGKIDFEFNNRYEISIKILKEKESICDVKVSDFIEKNIRKRKLFFTQNHPTTCVFIHCVNQILSILGYNVKYDTNNFKENICDFVGEWPHTSYDNKFWDFQYKINNINDEIYINHIKIIYNNY